MQGSRKGYFIMVDAKKIEAVTSKLVETYNPLEIYIFGSYAWGAPHEDSDLDIMIVVDRLSSDRYKMLAKGHLALFGLKLSKDIILYSKKEFEDRCIDKMTMCYRVKSEGIKVYAKA